MFLFSSERSVKSLLFVLAICDWVLLIADMLSRVFSDGKLFNRLLFLAVVAELARWSQFTAIEWVGTDLACTEFALTGEAGSIKWEWEGRWAGKLLIRLYEWGRGEAEGGWTRPGTSSFSGQGTGVVSSAREESCWADLGGGGGGGADFSSRGVASFARNASFPRYFSRSIAVWTSSGMSGIIQSTSPVIKKTKCSNTMTKASLAAVICIQIAGLSGSVLKCIRNLKKVAYK